MLKPSLRHDFLAARRAFDGQQRIEAEHAITARLLELLQAHPDAMVAGYAAMRAEVSLDALANALAEQGRPYALPRIADESLTFHRYTPGDTLVGGAHGQSEPLPDAPAVQPRILLVPMLAFDRAGHRLGYGGGFYDRTLAQLRQKNALTLAVGIAFALQETPGLPTEPHDQQLDAICTDKALIKR